MFSKFRRLMFSVVLVSSIFVTCFLNSPNVFAQNTIQPVAYVPITIANTQDVATPNPFQQMIVVNSALYAKYEASDLSNVAFSYNNGTIAPSWLASGNSNISTNTIYWVKLDSISAGSSTTVYMNFFPTTSNVLNSQTTGEAPELSPSRGQYDNGANVFIVYADFLRGLNGWQPFNLSGNFVPTSTSKGIELLDNGAPESTYMVSPVTLPAIPVLIEEGWDYNGYADSHAISAFGSSPYGTTSTVIIDPVANTGAPVLSNSVCAFFDYWTSTSALGETITNSQVGASSFSTVGSFSVVSFLTINGSWASYGYAPTNVNIAGFGWTSVAGAKSGTVPRPFSNSAFIISARDSGFSSYQYVRWVVVSALPPNGIMPSVQMGNVAPTIVPSVSISPSSVGLDVGQLQLFFSSVANGTSPFSYQWYLNDTAVSGATGSSWTFVSSSSGSYSVYLNVTDSAGFRVKSNVVAVAVNSIPSVSVSPGSAISDAGQTQLFTSTVSNGTSPFSYQWILNDTAVSGATGSTWAFVPSSAGSYSVYLNVTDSVGDRVKSNTAMVTVSTAIPEFTPAFALPLFIVATLMIVIVQERKHGDNRQRALRELP